MNLEFVDNDKIKVEVPEDIVNNVQRAAFEYETYKDNIAFLLDTRRDDPTLIESENFKKYCKLQATAKAEFEFAKQELERLYKPKELDGHQAEWSLDYSSRILTFTVKCECGKQILKELKGEN